MKTSTFTFLALTSTFVTAAPWESNLVIRTESEAAAVDTVTDLYYDIIPLAANITFTAISLNSASTAADNETAASALTGYISNINSLVTDTTSQVEGSASKRDKIDAYKVLVERQTTAPTDPLAAELAMILQEIGTALNSIIATLGLTATLSFLGPLVLSLSALLAALIPVVNNLLALVEELLDGLLGGLSLALAGLDL